MKKLILLIGVTALLMSCATPRDLVVILTVDADALMGLGRPPTQQDISDNVILTDDYKGRFPNRKGVEKFKSRVFYDKYVTWLGLTNDTGYSVDILNIEQDPSKATKYSGQSTNFFDTNLLAGSGGIVRKQISKDLNHKKYYYKIKFKITPDPAGLGDLTVDPILKMK